MEDEQNHAPFAHVEGTFEGAVDTDTSLEAAAREAGWALMELVDGIAWEKREHISQIITRLGLALNKPNMELVELRRIIRDNWCGDYWRAVNHRQADEVRAALTTEGQP